MALRGKLNQSRWQVVGLAALAGVTAAVSVLAVVQSRTPVAAVASSASPTEGPTATKAETPPSPETSASPSPSPSPSATLSPLAQAAALLDAPDASAAVFGDGSGNEEHEWVFVWAREHLATTRAVEFHDWDRGTASYSSPVDFGNGSGDKLTLWNGSVRSPDLAQEPKRIANAWQDVDVVLLSYGRRQSPETIAERMSAILAAIRSQSSDVAVVVVLQNPDPAATAETQTKTVQNIAAWAEEMGLPTLDVYSAFPQDQKERDALVGNDGSPNEKGSELFAQVVTEALTPAP